MQAKTRTADDADRLHAHFQETALELSDAAHRHSAAIIALLDPEMIADAMLAEQQTIVRRGINRCIRQAMRGHLKGEF